MKKYKEIYVCDKCGCESENPEDFLEFIGNVMIPGNKGGIIGNNIYDVNNIPEDLQNAISTKQIEIVNINNACVITPKTYCIKCTIELLMGQPKDTPKEKINKVIESLKETYLTEKKDESN